MGDMCDFRGGENWTVVPQTTVREGGRRGGELDSYSAINTEGMGKIGYVQEVREGREGKTGQIEGKHFL